MATDTSLPGPRIDLVPEMVRWWDRWLRGRRNGVDEGPPVTVFVRHSTRPAPDLDTQPGAWRDEPAWPPARATARTLTLGEATSAPGPTGSSGGAATPEVSPDGQTVTFLSFPPPGDLGAIFAIGIHGGPVRQVTPTLNGITFKHDWAPNGSRLVMSDNADNPDLPVNVVTIRPDGTGLKYLTDNQTPDQRAFAGSYSPNGKWIVFRQESGDQSALMVMRTNGQGMHAILPFSDFRPRSIDWGPVPS